MFEVFDCTAAEGRVFVTRHRWLAHLAAIIVSTLTGRTFDFAREGEVL